ncbi:hypothetical protein P154DRAFT_503115 [Amniculicola lignicola CBS 123094]|uniref:Cora-domain-containing protein n=1 Tax=Amniculicola lignicola CBS 123094 TaxID=1392246 RepID=A0A6A5VXL7_9PLEO|nr:hypothetical protein P154DRAFT_503115 [Amniculicola lignicola CBS 123094]
MTFNTINSTTKCAKYVKGPSFDAKPDLATYPREITALSVSSAAITQVSMTLTRTVYALSSQRDNEINLRLAKLSQERNDQNFKIAQFTAHESRMSTIMARSAVSHGLDMRLISLVTLLFLPGTFMATLFSAGFWNFEPGHEGPVVSKWAWVYLVLTVTLTVAVLAAWRYLSGRKKKEELSMDGKVDLSFLEGLNDDKNQASDALSNSPPPPGTPMTLPQQSRAAVHQADLGIGAAIQASGVGRRSMSGANSPPVI